jgi:hypothetical protein
VLDGTAYEHAERDPELAVGNVRRFENKTEPEVIAQVPLAGGGTVEVYAVAKRWNPARILVSWADDDMHPHWRGPSRQCPPSHRLRMGHLGIPAPPEKLRGVRWGDRLPGFLPE